MCQLLAVTQVLNIENTRSTLSQHDKGRKKDQLDKRTPDTVIIFGLCFAFFTHFSGKKRTVSKYVR